MYMLFEELKFLINDNCIVELYRDAELVAIYDGKESIPEEYDEAIVEDIYANGNKLCIEIE